MPRKPKYKTAEEMQTAIDRYFTECDGEPFVVDGVPVMDKYGQPVIINVHPPTVTGLAYALGFTSRQALLNYQGKAGFVDTVTRAKLRIEKYAEERLFDRDGQRGAEFTLRYNFRWDAVEKEEQEAGGVVMLAPVMENPGPPEEAEHE